MFTQSRKFLLASALIAALAAATVLATEKPSPAVIEVATTAAPARAI